MKEWFKARNIWNGAFTALSDAEAGRLAKALWHYTTTGEQVELSGNEKGCFAMIIYTLQQDEADSGTLSEKRREAGGKGGRQRVANQANANFASENEANQANASNKNKNKIDSNCGNSDNAREEGLFPVEVDPLIVKVQRELNGLTDTHYQALNDYREELTDEVVSHAIDNAVANGSRNWAYVESILRAYTQEHITTIGAAKAADEKHRANKTVKFPQKNGNGPKPYFNPYMDMLKEGVFDDIG